MSLISQRQLPFRKTWTPAYAGVKTGRVTVMSVVRHPALSRGLAYSPSNKESGIPGQARDDDIANIRSRASPTLPRNFQCRIFSDLSCGMTPSSSTRQWPAARYQRKRARRVAVTLAGRSCRAPIAPVALRESLASALRMRKGLQRCELRASRRCDLKWGGATGWGMLGGDMPASPGS